MITGEDLRFSTEIVYVKNLRLSLVARKRNINMFKREAVEKRRFHGLLKSMLLCREEVTNSVACFLAEHD